MKKILILAGGSGPANLLNGLGFDMGRAASNPMIKVQVLINALDNGLSTGQCRQIFDGKLLGPSDVRKNAMSQFSAKDVHEEKFAAFMNSRFNSPSADAENYVTQEISALNIDESKKEILQTACTTFFKRPLARTIDYHDFSMANLIYSGVAAQHDLSLTKASRFISKNLLNIPEDFVLLNSDESVYINAVTASGKILTDEVDIDEWDDITDRILDIFFTDVRGIKIAAPVLNEEARLAVEDADIIIFSSGTQWTSLIPTYETTGFREALNKSNAKKYLVMNNVADTDMTGLTSIDMLNVLKQWLPVESITTVLNSGAAPDMQLEPKTPFIKGALSCVLPARHSGSRLVKLIFEDYYSKELKALDSGAVFLTDYDDTLVGRNGSYLEVSRFNKATLSTVSQFAKNNVAIVTGNSIRSIDTLFGGLQVFADNASNEYFCVHTLNSYNDVTGARYKLKGPVSSELMFSQEEVDDITKVITHDCGIDISKITSKGFAGVAVKPIVAEYRAAIRTLLECIVDPSKEKYTIVSAGRTTVDIYKKGVTKLNVINKFLVEGKQIVYIGDEWEKGNDADVYQASLLNKNIIYMKINDPADTALFFHTIAKLVKLDR